jgi:hypothetical protein
VRGFVRDAEREPVRGVVRATARAGRADETVADLIADAEGRFRAQLPAGECEFSFEFPGGARITRRVALPEAGEVRVEIDAPPPRQ